MSIKKRERNIGNILLSLAKITGWSLEEIMTLGQTPHLWSGYESYGMRARRELDEKIRQEIYYLLKKEYIVRTAENGLALTEEGLKKALSYHEKEYKKLKSGKCLCVIFDIPNEHKKGRDNFRNYLAQNHFEKLQKSVWLTRYDVYKDLFSYIKENGISKWIDILVVEKIAFNKDVVKKVNK